MDIESTRTPMLYNINGFFKFDWSGAIVRALEGMIHCRLSNQLMMGLRKTLQANCAPLCVEMGFV